jgi:hypothetical protein
MERSPAITPIRKAKIYVDIAPYLSTTPVLLKTGTSRCAAYSG